MEQADKQKLAEKTPKWMGKRVWKDIYGKLLFVCDYCLWGPANNFLIMAKDHDWLAEPASGRSGHTADEHKGQLEAVRHDAFDLHQIFATPAFTSDIQFQFFSLLLKTMLPTSCGRRLCLPSLTLCGQT